LTELQIRIQVKRMKKRRRRRGRIEEPLKDPAFHDPHFPHRLKDNSTTPYSYIAHVEKGRK
jgi:hypothetical protein